VKRKAGTKLTGSVHSAVFTALLQCWAASPPLRLRFLSKLAERTKRPGCRGVAEGRPAGVRSPQRTSAGGVPASAEWPGQTAAGSGVGQDDEFLRGPLPVDRDGHVGTARQPGAGMMTAGLETLHLVPSVHYRTNEVQLRDTLAASSEPVSYLVQAPFTCALYQTCVSLQKLAAIMQACMWVEHRVITEPSLPG